MQVDQQNRVIVFQSLNTVFVNEKIPLFVWLCISCTGIYLFGKLRGYGMAFFTYKKFPLSTKMT